MDKKSIFSSKFIYYLLIFPIIEPDYFKYYEFTDNIFIGLKFLVLLTVTIYMILYRRRIPLFSKHLLLYILGFFLVTLINKQDLFYVLKKFIEIFLIVLIFEIGYSNIKNKILIVFFKYLFILIVINFLLLIIFPNGLVLELMSSDNYKMYFLSIKNGLINWIGLEFIIGLILLTIDKKNKTFKTAFHIFILISIYTIFVTGSSTGIIILSILLFYYLINNKINFSISIKSILPMLIIFFILIVFFRIGDYFSPIFEFLFNKDSTFTGRTNLWDQSLIIFSNNPVFGTGIREISLINYYGRSFTSHNLVLEILMTGGIFQLLFFFDIIYVITKGNNNIMNYKLKNTLTFAFVVFYLSTIGGSALFVYQWYLIWVIIYYGSKYQFTCGVLYAK